MTDLRNLDAEIHKKIFGFTDLRRLPVITSPDCGNRMIADHPKAELDWCYLPKYDHNETGDIYCRVIPCYSTKIEAAWEIVEFLKKRWRIEVNAMMGKNGNPLYLCRIFWVEDYDDETPIAMEYAETAPLSICKTALKVIDKFPNN